MNTYTEQFYKAASLVMMKQAVSAPHGGMGIQQYLPPSERRELSEDEEGAIGKAQKKIIPKIFKSDQDPIHADMSSKGWTAGASGLAGGLLGALGGGVLGSMGAAEPGGMTPETGMNIGAGLGALSAGALATIIGWHTRKAENETLEERVRRLPEGSNRRDMKSDPVYQQELNRENELRAAAARAAAYG